MMYHTIYCINYKHPTHALYLSIYIMPIYISITTHLYAISWCSPRRQRLVRNRVRNIDYAFQRPLCDDSGNLNVREAYNLPVYVIKVFL